ncbi:hypothetical protein D3C80_2205370 [compost metagenome]
MIFQALYIMFQRSGQGEQRFIRLAGVMHWLVAIQHDDFVWPQFMIIDNWPADRSQ